MIVKSVHTIGLIYLFRKENITMFWLFISCHPLPLPLTPSPPTPHQYHSPSLFLSSFYYVLQVYLIPKKWKDTERKINKPLDGFPLVDLRENIVFSRMTKQSSASSRTNLSPPPTPATYFGITWQFHTWSTWSQTTSKINIIWFLQVDEHWLKTEGTQLYLSIHEMSEYNLTEIL